MVLSMLDETAYKTVHKQEAGDCLRKKEKDTEWSKANQKDILESSKFPRGKSRAKGDPSLHMCHKYFWITGR